MNRAWQAANPLNNLRPIKHEVPSKIVYGNRR